MPDQSLPLSMLLSAVGGSLGVLSTAVLAYPDAKAKAGEKWSKCSLNMALFLNLFLQVCLAVANITASWFGPVSIVVPTNKATSLVVNMLVFGAFLGLEAFKKEMRVGTYVVVVAAIQLPIVGPGVQEDQDILDLLTKPGAIAWSAILMACMGVSFVGLLIAMKGKSGKKKSRAMFIFNLSAQTSAAILGTTLSKMFVLVDGQALGVVVGLWALSSAILTVCAILQATTVNQGTFVPLNTAASIITNAVTGIIIWEDWRVIESWMGYVTVFMLLLLGNYLLSSYDLFGPGNKQYGAAETANRLKLQVLGESPTTGQKVDAFVNEGNKDSDVMEEGAACPSSKQVQERPLLLREATKQHMAEAFGVEGRDQGGKYANGVKE